MFKYTLLSYITALCAVLVVGQVNQNSESIQMTDGRVISSVLEPKCTTSPVAGGRFELTTCPAKSGEKAQFKATIIVNGGLKKLEMKRLRVTLQLGDSNIVTQALTCQVADGTLVIGSAPTACSTSNLAGGSYSVAPLEVPVPVETETKVLDLKILAVEVTWSDDTTQRDVTLGKLSVLVLP